MKILDRYVLSSFLANYVICFAVLVGLYVIVDASERFEDVKEWSELAGKTEHPLLYLARFYAYNVPVIFVQVAPAITLMAAMFTMTRLARSGEIVPMKASGISLYRVLAPILIVAGLLALASVAIQEILIPRNATKLRELLVVNAKDRLQYHAVILQDEQGTIYFIERFYPHQDPPRIEGLRILERHAVPPHRQKRVIKAEHARWDSGGSRLVLSNGMIDEFEAGDGHRRMGFPKLFGEGEARYATALRPVDIIFTDQQTLLSFRGLEDLKIHARRHPGIAPVQVEIASRFTRPLAHVLLLFLGLPFVLGKETKNFFLGAAFAVLVSGAYFFVSLYATKLGYQAHVHPMAAAWIPVILFGSLGAGLLDMIRT